MRKIIIAGGTGFLGRVLTNHFNDQENQVTVLTRGPSREIGGVQYINWDGENLGTWTACLESADVLINLSGRTVDCRYNLKNRSQIYDSRLHSTRVLAEALKTCERGPSLWMNMASATIYRYAEDREMDECEGDIGSGFSVDVCQRWEEAFYESDLEGVRKVCLRTAMVMGTSGDFMKKMLKLVRLGLGGRLGTGAQYVSWLHERDWIGMVQFLIEHDDLEGTFNLSSPQPETNEVMMSYFRDVCNKNFGLAAPEFLVKIGAFFMRTEAELPLKSRRVVPRRLLEAGYTMQFSEMRRALEHLINEEESANETATLA